MLSKKKEPKKKVYFDCSNSHEQNHRSLKNNTLKNYNPQTILYVQFSKFLPGSSLYVCMKCSTCSKWSTREALSRSAQCRISAPDAFLKFKSCSPQRWYKQSQLLHREGCTQCKMCTPAAQDYDECSAHRANKAVHTRTLEKGYVRGKQ